MKSNQWTREELIIAFNLYCKIPFGRIHIRNPEIIELAKAFGRTPSSVSWKLANFARLDPALQQRNIKGAAHGSKGEEEIWKEFHSNWDRLAFESERCLAELLHKPVEKIAEIETDDLPKEGKERESVVMVRVNQQFFRKSVLAAHENKCCLTGLTVPELLVASHIVPWAVDESNRINPKNGLCLNALHDRAFDRGLMTVTPDFEVRFAKSLLKKSNEEPFTDFIGKYHSKKIKLPNRFQPEAQFLDYHNQHIFVG
ncbi:MAG: restriction endonuclease [Deltaproteobacteria bacterium RIFCSPLOWO2_12_FULL_40_28]|nr:MAG: restriction endonuclease [Deltaproteobacteria bacterium RIFCSPHIGHO2_02_FULL_40_28]OGQ19249.1 MAG: restriction endonuclease [Deltaproteobacteria bacterium RIFCSPHIGHO2_12_FULL_40_32]OGQ40528.1 MAG: restriction endonuclease [Deltaproteobacteria bacterium RIFCSPLOWO2_02_FULL_40_36]OGQ53763.1 MAG: restriction endonuclease [Deltaproteobacteria bacterium RIFCSPLOWO2_12_FULL_40_28]OGX39429.1 MAG: restriction endonuclease [Omnitrophica WOR_2 bacterium RIFCSPLOWO2_01_FULL_41_12]